MTYTVLLIIFLCSLAIQLGYSILLSLSIIKYQSTPDSTIEPVSIVVCTHNRLQSLRKLIANLLEQRHPSFQVVVVNDRSTDGTKAFLSEVARMNSQVTAVTVEQTPQGFDPKKFALSQGIMHSLNDIILLTDDDCYPGSTQWVSQMSGRFDSRTHIVLGYSQYEHRRGVLNGFIRFETLLTGLTYLGLSALGRPYMGVGRNMAFRKSFFLEKNGYQEFRGTTGGDDDLFVNRNATQTNTRIANAPEAIVLSVPKEDLRSYFRQKVRHFSVGKMYKLSDKLRIGGQALTHLLFWSTFVILAAVGAYTGIILVGFLLRVLVNGVVYSKVARKLGDQSRFWYLPFGDLLYPIYYVMIGISAMYSKAVRWN